MLELEAANFARSIGQAAHAQCATTLISWQSAAIESGFSCVELASKLRDHNPDSATNLSNRWRDAVAELVRWRHDVVESRRAELIG